ncbi:MAG: CehA/McbA family metallohydrolase [Candidatus Bathyarchaeota archaeon]|nr:CehA/McbA family metallohydrolase [Candidatus Bathyarchaeum tardum]WGM89336.1 MAG: CehA/McbA family metallohydrolase [Candidatus Bathyarchaeum tardum]WNZ28389.1 MAG: CehA/McbA family metallohydrolase [Candidatus Bathyarchaeota archaeon]
MGLKIDFHVHTCYSKDSSITLEQVVSFAKKRGLDGVAITDHNSVEGALKLKTKEIIVIPGIEVSTLQGHLLGINLTTPIPAKLSMEETIQQIHEAGGIAVAAHPTAFYKSPATRKVTSYDAVEVMNAASIPFSVLTHYSRKFAEQLNLPQTGGSDSHYAPEIGSAYTVVDADPNIDEIAKAVIRGATSPRGKGIPFKIRVKRSISKFKRKM